MGKFSGLSMYEALTFPFILVEIREVFRHLVVA